MDRKLISFASSIGSIDFTSAAFLSVLGFKVGSYINEEAPLAKDPSNVPFDSRSGIPTPVIERSPDGTFRQLYAPLIDRDPLDALHLVADLLLGSGYVVDERIVRQRVHVIGKIANGGADERIRVLDSVYRATDLSVAVGSFSEFRRSRSTLNFIFSSLNSWIGSGEICGVYKFARGGRIEVELPGGLAIFRKVLVEAGVPTCLFGEKSDGSDVEIHSNSLLVGDLTARVRGPLEVIYINPGQEGVAHLPWHTAGVLESLGSANGVIAEVASPPATVDRGRAHLTPSAYLMIDYPGVAGEYGRNLIGEQKWMIPCINLVLSRASPVKEKLSRSQRNASRISGDILSSDLDLDLPWPYSQLRREFQGAHAWLKNNVQDENGFSGSGGGGSLASVVNSIDVLLRRFNLGGLEVSGYTSKRLDQFLFGDSGVSGNEYFRRVRFVSRCYAEMLTVALMLISETVLRADIVTLAILGVQKEDFLMLARLRRENQNPLVRWWRPVLLEK
ncbi:hypothetical protein [Nocardiopsis changdeensis]|uniref:hypothetical protein n=1 Tax=Nocardiopsis changdeensis TaxID=2831969 RepID=UPI003F48A74C